ncbi:TIGR03618 family F420-dependent PPOX class oxidoreductase [Pseudonocardia sichuanensis]
MVISGGTDGIGRAVALAHLERGGEAAVIGRDAAKGAAFLEAAAALGAAGRAHFVRADLSLVAGTRAAIEEIRAIFTKVDALVLCARHYRSTRRVTAEGFEHTFALYYLSRFVLTHEMADLLDAADAPVVLNVAGVPGAGADAVDWNDLQGERGYHGMRALAQAARLTDLLGIASAQDRVSAKARYVLLFPGVVATSFSGEYDAATAAEVEALRASATPVDEAIVPILDVLEHPPAEPLSAIDAGRRIDVDTPAFDVGPARRLHAETVRLLSPLASAEPGVSPAKLRRLLDRPVFATVATVQPDGSPHQSVVWVTREGDDVLFAVAVGSRKERNLRRDPRVSVLLTPPEAPYTYAAVHGTAAVRADGGDALRDALAVKYTGMTYAEHNRDAAARHGEVAMAVVRVTPERVVGRL